MERSAIGQTHPVEKIYPARCNIAADAAREGRLSVDNCALLLTSDDWLRSLANTARSSRDRGLSNRFRYECINYGESVPLSQSDGT